MPVPAKRKGNGKPRGIRHDRDCTTCKTRRVKCDLNRPKCGQCLRDQVSCGGYSRRIVWRAPHSTSTPPPSIIGQRSRGIGPHWVNDPPSQAPVECDALVRDAQIVVDDSNWTTHYVNYLNHFRKRDQLELDTPQPGNTSPKDPLLSVWHFAWKRMMRNADNASDVDPDLSNTAAIKALLQAIDQEGIEAIFGIATFAFIDVYKAPFGAWSRHLRGARAVLDLHSPTPERFSQLCLKVKGLQEVLSLLCWYDVTGLMVRRDRHLIFEDWHRDLMDGSLFDLVGCPSDAFKLLAAVAKEGFESSCRPPELYIGATSQLLKVSRGSNEHELLCDAWRYAVVLAVHEAGSGVQKEGLEAVTDGIADLICNILQTVSVKSAKYRHLPFAAFMAGRHAQSVEHLQAVQTYWRCCSSLETPIYPDGERVSQPITAEVDDSIRQL